MSKEVIFVSRYETLLLELLWRLDEKADRIAVALEKLSPPDKRGYEAKIPVPEKSLADAIRDSLLQQAAANDQQKKPFPGKVDIQTVGQRIKAARKDAGLTQQELGEKIGSPAITIRQWESGKREPNLRMIYRVASALGVHVSVFFPDVKGDDL